jgi:hypothetical protein
MMIVRSMTEMVITTNVAAPFFSESNIRMSSAVMNRR